MNDILSTLISNIKTLSTLKKKNLQNSGKLKFCSEYKALNYIQYGITHKIVDKNKIKLQGIKKALTVKGINRLKNKEITNVILCNTPKGYYIRVTTFTNKDGNSNTNITNKRIIGIDFGCQTSLTTSEGSKIKVEIKETDRLKKLQKSLSKKQKMSNNFNKTKKLIQIEYQNITNRKNDVSNKIVHDLLKNDVIVIQDEQLKNWHHNRCFSKSIQHSILGRVKSKLLLSGKTIVVSKWCPSSKLCYNCGKFHKDLKLCDRTFKCECGVEEDRDAHAAKNMVWFYEHSVGVGRTNFKPVEIRTSINEVFKNTLKTSCRSMKQEAMNL